MSTTSASPSQTLYFGYGSNLWLEQMKARCPTSTYLGVGRLNSYRWMINERNYANVVQTESDEDVVYGLVYRLLPKDEERLDRNEGVPYAYTKEDLSIDFWPSDSEKDNGWVDVGKPPQEKKTLVYIDRKRLQDDKPKKEYIVRMNKGIKDALALGVPKDYVETVIRKFIPPEDEKETEELARKQALKFEDER